MIRQDIVMIKVKAATSLLPAVFARVLVCTLTNCLLSDLKAIKATKR